MGRRLSEAPPDRHRELTLAGERTCRPSPPRPYAVRTPGPVHRFHVRWRPAGYEAELKAGSVLLSANVSPLLARESQNMTKAVIPT